MIWKRFAEEASCYTDGEPLSLFGAIYLLLFNSGFQLNMFYRMTHYLHSRFGKKRLLWILPKVFMLIERVWTGSFIDPGARIGKRFKILYGMNIVIGEYVIIGDDVTLFNGVSLGSVIPGLPEVKQPEIGDRVMIGTGAKILGGVSIGSGSKIGANSVVLISCQPNTTLAGLPAKIVRQGN